MNPEASPLIADVFSVPLSTYSDSRGRFTETFRHEWFPWVNWDRMQGNYSKSQAHVLRGLHYHRHQLDYWVVLQGVARVGLVDLRPDSPTFRASEIVTLDGSRMSGLLIPIGVAHGFLAVTEVSLIYTVNAYYDGSDEHGVLWSDPALGLDWGCAEPILSPRDQLNPLLQDIPLDRLPLRSGPDVISSAELRRPT